MCHLSTPWAMCILGGQTACLPLSLLRCDKPAVSLRCYQDVTPLSSSRHTDLMTCPVSLAGCGRMWAAEGQVQGPGCLEYRALWSDVSQIIHSGQCLLSDKLCLQASMTLDAVSLPQCGWLAAGRSSSSAGIDRGLRAGSAGACPGCRCIAWSRRGASAAWTPCSIW